VLAYLAAGMSEDQILREFPRLTHEDISVPCVRGGARTSNAICSSRVACALAIR
jgi:Protein of unknown function (DUF433)